MSTKCMAQNTRTINKNPFADRLYSVEETREAFHRFNRTFSNEKSDTPLRLLAMFDAELTAVVDSFKYILQELKLK